MWQLFSFTLLQKGQFCSRVIVLCKHINTEPQAEQSQVQMNRTYLTVVFYVKRWVNSLLNLALHMTRYLCISLQVQILYSVHSCRLTLYSGAMKLLKMLFLLPCSHRKIMLLLTMDSQSNRLQGTPRDHLIQPFVQSRSNWIQLL